MAELLTGEVHLYYDVKGQGAPLLLLPGIASDSGSWGTLVGRLAARHLVITPDHRGTGRSQPELPEISIPLCAEDAAALIRSLDAGPAHVVGHSMGGLIALQLAAEHPGLVRSLTLLATAPLRSGRNQHLLETLVQLRAPGMDERLWLRAFYPWLLRPALFQVPGIVEVALKAALAAPYAQTPAQFAAQVAAVGAWNSLPAAQGVTVPCQAILGAEDLLYPEATARAALEKSLPGVRITTIAGAAHAVHLDQPDQVAAAILALTDPG